MTSKFKKLLCIVCALALVFTFAGCGEDNSSKDNVSVPDINKTELLSGLHHAEIKVKDIGVIKLELDADTAPITVTNFVNLAKAGFYDGLTFHRVIEGFMIQGGDPKGNGTGGAKQTITGEFSSNGIENNLKHTRGIISMARSNDPNSASSQFFIMHAEASHLDGSYAAFGWVTEGMNVVDKIAQETPVIDNNGTVKDGCKPVIEYIKILD